ncbi:UNKNOWN [Stylonychia lemnae]|uniref:Uncharacterized protein n=1 Tax=Stylonychia lemnae TaxID=5949 RepID=A0A078AN21_STYLE|nr:UNKNOWN [Stylonychia lemnae]|eukprot:CDW83765.1 UNKNOWN [Stylonychia lemnae]
MKKYINIVGVAVLGHAVTQENVIATELSVQNPNPQVILYSGYDPLYEQQHQLKEGAYLDAMQKIYGTSVQSPKDDANNDDPLFDLKRELKQADYLQMLQNIQDRPQGTNGANPLSNTEYQLREQAYLQSLQKIYGTKVQEPMVQMTLNNGNVQQQQFMMGYHQITDAEIQKELDYMRGRSAQNAKSPNVQKGNELSELQREMIKSKYLGGMQNINGHYANVQSPQYGYYDPLYQQKHQLKQGGYLDAMQKIYGTSVQEPNVQGGDPLADVEREMKQAAYLEALQNIHGHYNVQSSKVENIDNAEIEREFKQALLLNPINDIVVHPYANVQARLHKQVPVDPLQQTQWELKEQAKLEALQKIYGNNVQSGNPLSDLEREMKQATYLNGMQNIYGHYAKVQSPKSQYLWENYQQIECKRAPCPSYPMSKMHNEPYNQDVNKIYGPQVQKQKAKDYNPLADVEREMKQAAYLEALERIHGDLTPHVQDYKDKSEMRPIRGYRSDWEDDE